MLPHQSNNLIRGKRKSVGMDSYVGLCRAPYLPLLPQPCTLIREEESPLLLIVREIGGGTHFPKGLAYIFHGTLRMSCLSSADNSLGTLWRTGGKREGEEQGSILNMRRYICLSFRFLLQFLAQVFNGLHNGGAKCSLFSLFQVLK